jgi:hypothetical protein
MELIVVFIPYRGKRISDLGILIVFLFITIPVISYWALADRGNGYVIIVSLFTIFLSLLSKKKVIAKLPYIKGGHIYVFLMHASCGIIFFLIAGHQGAFRKIR